MTVAAIAALVVTVAVMDPLRSRCWAVSLACAVSLVLSAVAIELMA